MLEKIPEGESKERLSVAGGGGNRSCTLSSVLLHVKSPTFKACQHTALTRWHNELVE